MKIQSFRLFSLYLVLALAYSCKTKDPVPTSSTPLDANGAKQLSVSSNQQVVVAYSDAKANPASKAVRTLG